jgi:hypothetical protein
MNRWLAGLLICPSFSGCMFLEENSSKDPARPIVGRDGWSQKSINAPPAPLESASRVDQAGRHLLASNPQIGIRPVFTAIGTDKETVFHQGSNAIYISDGLVRKCKTDGELSAILSLELAKMISEKEADATPAAKNNRELEAPYAPNLTPDVAGGSMAPDMTRQAELAKFEKSKPKTFSKTTGRRILPNPDELAGVYLEKAGLAPDLLTKVEPLLRTAAHNPDFERQMNSKPVSNLGIVAEENNKKSETDR